MSHTTSFLLQQVIEWSDLRRHCVPISKTNGFHPFLKAHHRAFLGAAYFLDQSLTNLIVFPGEQRNATDINNLLIRYIGCHLYPSESIIEIKSPKQPTKVLTRLLKSGLRKTKWRNLGSAVPRVCVYVWYNAAVAKLLSLREHRAKLWRALVPCLKPVFTQLLIISLSRSSERSWSSMVIFSSIKSSMLY